MTRRLLVVLLAALCVLAALPAAAPADGDPASDFLLFDNSYTPIQPAPQKALRDQLGALLAAAKKQHHPLKVVVIRTKEDLGAFPQLFGKPKKYARLLASEIAYAYKGPLLIEMPQGFALHRLPATRLQLLHGLTVDAATPDAMTRTAITATQRLLKADGVDITNLPKPATAAPPTATSSSGTSPWLWVAIVLAGLAVGAGVGLVVIRMRG